MIEADLKFSQLHTLSTVTETDGFQCVGSAVIEDKATKEKVNIQLFEYLEITPRKIYAILSEANRHYVLGTITYIAVMTIDAHSKYTIKDVDIPQEDKQYYVKNKDRFKQSIFVDDLWCPGREFYKYIGKALLEYAKHESVCGKCEGRLMLEAANSSHGFYRKQNMKAMVGVGKWTAREVDNKIEQSSPSTKYLGQVLMYLPQNIIKLDGEKHV